MVDSTKMRKRYLLALHSKGGDRRHEVVSESRGGERRREQARPIPPNQAVNMMAQRNSETGTVGKVISNHRAMMSAAVTDRAATA